MVLIRSTQKRETNLIDITWLSFVLCKYTFETRISSFKGFIHGIYHRLNIYYIDCEQILKIFPIAESNGNQSLLIAKNYIHDYLVLSVLHSRQNYTLILLSRFFILPPLLGLGKEGRPKHNI